MKTIAKILAMAMVLVFVTSCYQVDTDSTTLEITSQGDGVVTYSLDTGDSGMIILSGVYQDYITLPTHGTMIITVETYTEGDYKIEVIERKGKGAATLFNDPVNNTTLFSFQETGIAKAQQEINL